MIYYLAPKGRCGVVNYINGRWRQSGCPEMQCKAFEDVFTCSTLPSGTWIFTGVEQLPPAGKRLADMVWQALTDAGQTVLNRPSLLPSRHGLLDTMRRVGINEFRSYLPDDIDKIRRYPVFVRVAEDHGGNLSGLLADRRELESSLRWQRLIGFKLDELLVIEFCDTANDLGEYRKYSAQCIQADVSARYLHVDKHWMVKAHGSTFRDEWAYEERNFIRENSEAGEIKKIFDLANIEYGRIDYGLMNGKIQVWEINTNPTIGGAPQRVNITKTPENVRRLQEPGKRIFFERFQSMLESIDSPHEQDVDIALRLPAVEMGTWREEVAANQRLLRRRKRLLSMSMWPMGKKARSLIKSVMGVARR